MLAEADKNDGGQFLGKSLKGFLWKLDEVDIRTITSIVQKLGTPEILAIILYNRGIKTPEEIEVFLNPKIRDSLPDPFDLKDMDRAAERITKAIVNSEKVTVFGDYDVDGATSTALLRKFFSDVGGKIDVYIPNRITEGYGPNKEAFRKLKDEGNSLVITVDCGTVSFDPIKYAKEIGLDIIVLDHHLGSEILPEAYAIVNPNRVDEDFSYKSLAAVGVVFLTVVAVRSKLREKGWFKDGKIVDLINYLDLVALGTVCDVMSLKGINRAFVSQGLKLLTQRRNLGLATLCSTARIEQKPQSYHLGFILGPRINAGGRIGEGRLGSDLLTTEDPDFAYSIALRLEQLNAERRTIETLTFYQAIEQIELNKLHEKPVIMVWGDDWHQGILGIIASRIKERYQKPAVVMSVLHSTAKGSARSINGIDLGSLIAKAKTHGLLLQGGGHAMAGGFVLEETKIKAFYEFLLNSLSGLESIYERALEHKVDALLPVSAINGNLVRMIDAAAPFGMDNSPPKFALIDITVTSVMVVGMVHLMVIVADKTSARASSNTLKCMLYRGLEHESGEFIKNSLGKKVTLIGTIKLNFNNDSKADFIIEDVIPVK
jgi:single-stranded-DNA-specific exonuclease